MKLLQILLFFPLISILSCMSTNTQIQKEPTTSAFPSSISEYAKMQALFLRYPSKDKTLVLQKPLHTQSFPMAPRSQAYIRYQAYIKEGAKEKMNFGGKYRIIQWGCGTECQTGVIINLATGMIYALPTSEWSIAFQENSLLLVENPPTDDPALERSRPAYAFPIYYVWQENEFIPLQPAK